MKKFRCRIEFDQGYCDHAEVMEFETEAEAEDHIKTTAQELLSWSTEELCPKCEAVIVPGCPCDDCAVEEQAEEQAEEYLNTTADCAADEEG